MKKILASVVMNFIFIQVSVAAGTLNLMGTVKSVHEKTVAFESSHRVYTLLRSSLGPAQDLSVKQAHPDKMLSLTVPFDGIESVKDLPAKKKLTK